MIKTMLYGINDSEVMNELIKKLDVRYNVHCIENVKKDISDIELSNNNFSFVPMFTKKNSEIYENFYKEHFSVFNKMFLVRGLYRSDYFEIENEFAIFFHSFMDILINKKIELIIFGALPHGGPDYILYKLAKKIGLKTILFYQTVFPNKFFMISDLDQFGKFDKKEKDKNINLDQILNDKNSYINEISKFNLKNSHNRKINFMEFLKEKRKLKRIIIKILIFLKIIKRVNKEKEFLKNLKNVQINENDLETILKSHKKKIYFPLHLQPEMTTSLLTKEYNDQIFILEKLISKLDDNWMIIIKENPRQSSYQRGKFFFKRIKYLKNIVFADSHHSSQDLLKRCDLIVTGAGTAGWEALLNSKKCLVFGNPWYLNLHGCLSFDDKLSKYDIEKFMNEKFDKDILIDDLKCLIKTCSDGVIADFYKKIYVSYDDSINSKVVSDQVIKFIKTKL